MRDGLLIRWRGPGEVLEWLRIEAGRIGLVQREQAPSAAVLARSARVVVLIPAEDVLSLGLTLPVKKRDAALKAAAFAVEEQVAAPIESLAVAISAQAVDGIWSCAVIARTRLAEIVADLAARGVRADAMHADAACLAAGERVCVDGERVLARIDRERALACDFALWPELAVRAGIDADAESSDDVLPLLAAQLRDAQPVSLLQGEFASAHRGADARRWWRVAAVLAGVSVMLGTLWMQLDTWRLQTRLNALNQAMETVYRTRFPDAKRVPQPRAMMEAALRQAGAEGAAGDSGLALLARAAAVIGNQTQVSIDGVEYRGGALELRLLAPDIGALDGLRESMAGALGQPVTLASANARAGRVEGRVRIGGAP